MQKRLCAVFDRRATASNAELADPIFIGRLEVHFVMTKTLAHQLAEYACSLKFEDLSKEVVHEVRRRMVDSIGCAIGAWNEEPCRIARSVALEFSARNGSTIIGTNHQAPP